MRCRLTTRSDDKEVWDELTSEVNRVAKRSDKMMAEAIRRAEEGHIFKSFLLGHKILKSTSVDCNKINIVTVKVRIMMWESPGNSHAIAIQWVHMVKDPPVTILCVHTVTSKYTFLLSIMIGI